MIHIVRVGGLTICYHEQGGSRLTIGQDVTRRVW
jgi:hypothetical protein